jgi:NAD+ synthase/NAD+ synthase (glutamine-hydrolysing)
MESKTSVGLVQTNPTVGDIKGNLSTVLDYIDSDNDLLIFPELTLTGYPPMDLLRHDEIIGAQSDAIGKISEKTNSIEDSPTVVLGAALENDSGVLENVAVVVKDGDILCKYAKRLLPTYDIFDEHRYFEDGEDTCVIQVKDKKVGLSVCEDAWWDVKDGGRRQHTENPISEYSDSNLDLLINLSASPFRIGKQEERIERFREHARAVSAPVVFVNQVGGNDEVLFDGGSFVVNKDGLVNSLDRFNKDYASFDVFDNQDSVSEGQLERTEEIRLALNLGIRDYFEKTGFEEAIIGMSGGIDSTVATTLAVDVLGSDNVYGVSLPSSVTSSDSVEDARRVADNLGIEFDVLSVESTVYEIDTLLGNAEDEYSGVAVENVQARVRGLILMGLANSRDALVLTPDNKSEAGVGYCTLYGDAVGAIAPLGDVYKKDVYRLANYYNQNSSEDVIPDSVINKKPTAELSEGQTDEDDLPPYDEIDEVLIDYIEDGKPVDRILEDNKDSVVNDVLTKIHRSEFKRYQTPPPLRVTKKAFGKGWKYPIAADYDELGDI